MNLEALALLETPTVRKLVATWPNVKDYSSDDAICRRWAEITALNYRIAKRWLLPLLENDIIRRDGTISDIAASHIATVALSRVKVTRERKPKGMFGGN